MVGPLLAPVSWTNLATSFARARSAVSLPLHGTDSLNVLIVLAGPDPACTPLAAGLRGHSTLVCESGPRALQAVDRGFVPDVVLLDTRLPKAARLVRQITARRPDDTIDFVALHQPGDTDLPTAFTHRLAYPATASELDRVLQQVVRARTLRQPKGYYTWGEEVG
jgi:CheY-like chemotaxis protein